MRGYRDDSSNICHQVSRPEGKHARIDLEWGDAIALIQADSFASLYNF